jgi:hypothetical protein
MSCNDKKVTATYIGKLLAVFLLFKLLPVPVDFNVLLVRGDDFVLNFVGSFLFLLFFEVATLVLGVVSVSFDSGDG